jgi:hypothetical protein
MLRLIGTAAVIVLALGGTGRAQTLGEQGAAMATQGALAGQSGSGPLSALGTVKGAVANAEKSQAAAQSNAWAAAGDFGTGSHGGGTSKWIKREDHGGSTTKEAKGWAKLDAGAGAKQGWASAGEVKRN